MKTIKIKLGKNFYPILIGTGLLLKAGKLMKATPNINTAFVITNDKIKALYASRLAKSLKNAGITPNFITVADTEKSKSINAWIKVIRKITELDKGKGIVIIAFGGGVIGDLSGFVAASYKRGVPLAQIPTTLLAQVDSAIGGKTAVDLPFGKNLIGAFYQPRMVISDIELLKSLPLRELKNGLAEVIKYAVIFDEQLFQYLEKNLKNILRFDKNSLLHIVTRSSQLKAKVVMADEKETRGYRSLLNLGHTIGHAIEAAASYGRMVTHGEAVALGMLCACDIAQELKLLKRSEAIRIETLIKEAGLPTAIRGLSVKKIFGATMYDKKIIAGRQRFVLPVRIGHAVVSNNLDRMLIKDAITRRKNREGPRCL